MDNYGLGQHVVSEIDKVKYDGRLIVLEDGSRWEVSSGDVDEAESWDPLDKVVVIDDEMYNIEHAPKISVEEEE